MSSQLCPCCKARAERKAAACRKRRKEGAARREQAILMASDDAVLLHTVGGASLERASKLASAFHKAKWTRVLAELRRRIGYATGRPSLAKRTEETKRERAA